jgi:hypothetical protein
MPLLDVVTRCYKRPAMLRHNRASIEMLGPEARQTFLVDEVGRGIAWSYEQLATYEPQGEWVWLLDDDDLCIYPSLLYDLAEIDKLFAFDVVMVKMDRDGHIMPDKFTWQRPPQLGHVCVSCFIVQREIWMRHRGAFVPGRYSSDYRFIDSVFCGNPQVYWLDVVASKTQKISRGEPESA